MKSVVSGIGRIYPYFEQFLIVFFVLVDLDLQKRQQRTRAQDEEPVSPISAIPEFLQTLDKDESHDQVITGGSASHAASPYSQNASETAFEDTATSATEDGTPFDDAPADEPTATHIPRPPNSFFVFRSYAYANNLCEGKLQQKMSKAIGDLWKSMTPEQKAPFEKTAEEAAVAHKLQYPNYKYEPNKGGKRARRRGANTSVSRSLGKTKAIKKRRRVRSISVTSEESDADESFSASASARFADVANSTASSPISKRTRKARPSPIYIVSRSESPEVTLIQGEMTPTEEPPLNTDTDTPPEIIDLTEDLNDDITDSPVSSIASSPSEAFPDEDTFLLNLGVPINFDSVSLPSFILCD